MRFSTFPKGISLKVDVTALLEFEFVCFEATVQHLSYYNTGNSPAKKSAASLSLVMAKRKMRADTT